MATKRRFSDGDIYCCKRGRLQPVEKRVRFDTTESEEPIKKRLKFDNSIEYLSDEEVNDIRLVISECVTSEMNTEVELIDAPVPVLLNARRQRLARRIQQHWRRRMRKRSDELGQLNFGLLRLT
jgi:hypothetical protein